MLGPKKNLFYDNRVAAAKERLIRDKDRPEDSIIHGRVPIKQYPLKPADLAAGLADESRVRGKQSGTTVNTPPSNQGTGRWPSPTVKQRWGR